MNKYMTVVKIVVPEGDITYETHHRVSSNSEEEAFLIKLQELLEKEAYYDYISNSI